MVNTIQNQNKKSEKALTDEVLLSDIFRRFYFSSILAIICNCIGQIVGNMVIGNTFGEEKLAVMSLVLPVYYIFATVGNLAGIGGSALCAAFIGKRNTTDCKKAFTVTYILTVLLCVFFGLIVIMFLPGIVDLLGTPPELYEDVKTYTFIMSAGGICTAGVYLSFNFLRLDGKAFETTLTFVIMAVLNVLLDVLLASNGIAGIALASVIGSGAATVFGLIILLRKSDTLKFTRITVSDFFKLSGEVFRVGSPGATENISILLKSYLLNRIITSVLGSAVLSSLSVVNSINSFSMAITVGCAGALVPIIGVFAAERDTISIKRMLTAALKLSGLLTALFVAFTSVFAPQVSALFGFVDGAYKTAFAVRLFVLSIPLALLTNLLAYLHLANNHTAISNIITVLRNFAFLVGSAFILMKLDGERGLWLSFAVCEAATLAATLIMHIIAKKKDGTLSLPLLLNTSFEKDGKSIAISTTDEEESISEAIEKLEEFCENNNFSPKQSMMITLSMDEMVHMAAEHSTKKGKKHIIGIRILYHREILVLRLRYAGEKFNPIEYYEQKKPTSNDIDAFLELDDCLGMKMVCDTCDVVDYRSTFGVNNLTLLF